ncbi:hypothetical protein [Demequina lutea]|uniref:Putative membrane protein n=1 Tax=Demequina lutea TaxID=431489 RepID=A0A7Z0CI62_9MICO|nr:hypothetical protein [Demequina lutea]NYI41564.1 putative membrane protein [Demequina lutea]
MTEIPPPPSMPPQMPPNMGMPSGPNPTAKNWMGIVALIVGILGILLACCWGSGILFAVGAVVLGMLGKKAVLSGEANNRGLANVGFILGIVGVALSIVVIILSILGIASGNSFNWGTN